MHLLVDCDLAATLCVAVHVCTGKTDGGAIGGFAAADLAVVGEAFHGDEARGAGDGGSAADERKGEGERGGSGEEEGYCREVHTY